MPQFEYKAVFVRQDEVIEEQIKEVQREHPAAQVKAMTQYMDSGHTYFTLLMEWPTDSDV